MHGHALAARHVTDDLFAMKRVAATRSLHHKIVNTTHDNRVVAQANQTFDSAYAASESRLFLLIELFKLFWSKILRDDVPRHEFAIPDPRQKIVDAPVTIVTGNTLHVLIGVAQQLLRRQLKPRRLFFEKLSPDLHRLRALLFRHPVTHAIARARGDDEVQPIARRM